MLEHGGNLRQAAASYSLPLSEWLDLSTGINPVSYPVPKMDTVSWQRLPEVDDGLVEKACEYYGCQSLLPTAGSQAGIQVLPRLRATCTVGMPRTMYQEHAYAWQQCGHQLVLFDEVPEDELLKQLDVLLVCNPNNPTGQRYRKTQLQQWHYALARKGGWLIVDEAFMDMTPSASMAEHSHLSGLIVLRSLGKFFGLAGARVGFLLAHPALLKEVSELLGPWTVSGPSRVVAQAALADMAWQKSMRQTLIKQSEHLIGCLKASGLTPTGGTALFQYVLNARAAEIQHLLAQQGIWVRRFEQPSALRFGLPESSAFLRLTSALRQLVDS